MHMDRARYARHVTSVQVLDAGTWLLWRNRIDTWLLCKLSTLARDLCWLLSKQAVRTQCLQATATSRGFGDPYSSMHRQIVLDICSTRRKLSYGGWLCRTISEHIVYQVSVWKRVRWYKKLYWEEMTLERAIALQYCTLKLWKHYRRLIVVVFGMAVADVTSIQYSTVVQLWFASNGQQIQWAVHSEKSHAHDHSLMCLWSKVISGLIETLLPILSRNHSKYKYRLCWYIHRRKSSTLYNHRSWTLISYSSLV